MLGDNMSVLRYKEIDKENFNPIVRLHATLTENQKKCVARNDYSIAEASVHPNNAYYRGIFLGDEPIGFFMVFIPDEASIKEGEDEFFLWRFMIARDHQRKGYGNIALDHICDMARKHGYKKLITSCETWDESPYPFYIKYGFKENGKKYGHEIGLEIEL